MARRSGGGKVRRWQGEQEVARSGGGKEVRRWQNYTSQGRLVEILQFSKLVKICILEGTELKSGEGIQLIG